MITLKSTTSKRRLVFTVAMVSTCMLLAMLAAFTSHGHAQTPTPPALSGIIDDFTPMLDASGPWQVSGQWSLTLVGSSGRGNFSVGLNMVRAENLNRMAHAHHVTLSDAQVTALENGFEISGPATITSNGNLAGFSGSTVTVKVTGGNAISFSNITLTFEDGAVAHFGDQPLHGVVTPR